MKMYEGLFSPLMYEIFILMSCEHMNGHIGPCIVTKFSYPSVVCCQHAPSAIGCVCLVNHLGRAILQWQMWEAE